MGWTPEQSSEATVFGSLGSVSWGRSCKRLVFGMGWTPEQSSKATVFGSLGSVSRGAEL